MVRAILAGAKTQTRRIVKPAGKNESFAMLDHGDGWRPWRSDDGESHVLNDGNEIEIACPYGQPGDQLWARETWQLFDPYEDPIPAHRFGPSAPYQGCSGDRSIEWRVCYRADGELDHPGDGKANWRPSIHMPRWASRINLTNKIIRCEQLQDISEADAKAEGVASVAEYNQLWNNINGTDAWDKNPWIWVIDYGVTK